MTEETDKTPIVPKLKENENVHEVRDSYFAKFVSN